MRRCTVTHQQRNCNKSDSSSNPRASLHSSIVTPLQETVEVFFDALHEAKDATFFCYFFKETMNQSISVLDSFRLKPSLPSLLHYSRAS